MTRRRFLAATVGSVAALSAAGALGQETDSLAVLEAPLIADLVALGAVLVPADVSPGMTRDDVLDWLHRMMERDGDTPIWLRRSMPTLHGAAGRFAALSPDQRQAVVSHLLDDPGDGFETEWHRRVVKPLMAHFYSRPRGYAVVGYENHNGNGIVGDITSYASPGEMPTNT
jgi:hypothetical protein